MFLSIVASSPSKPCHGDTLWGTLTVLPEPDYEPCPKSPRLLNRGRWVWSPSSATAAPDDPFWSETRQGRWYNHWDVGQFVFYADGRDECPSLIADRLFRPNNGIGTTGPGTLLRGDALAEGGREEADGERLACRWRLDASRPDHPRQD